MTMQNIDFLPQRYREQAKRRKAGLWRLALLVALGGAIGAAAAGQLWLRQRALARLAEIEPRYRQAQVSRQHLVAMGSEIESREAAAELYVWLGHPWPRTQILAEVVRPLPDEIIITEFLLTRESSTNSGSRFRNSGEQAAAEASAALPPAQQDLARLKREVESQPTVVHVRGVTTEVGILHRYVARLGVSQIFRTAELASHETAVDKGGVQFSLRLVVQSGYAQSLSYAEAPQAAPP